MLNQLMANKYVEHNFEPHGEETFNSWKDDPPSWFFNSQHQTLWDMHRGHCGPKSNMHKFDGTNSAGWVSQMEHLFFLHNIYTEVDKYQISLLYLHVECWQWWKRDKQCMGSHLNWSTFSKDICSHFD